MGKELEMCVDVLPPPKTYRERLALVHKSMWGHHTKLSIAFLEKPSPKLAERIEEVANEWTRFAGVTLQFGAPPQRAQIRIAFRRGAGSWSYVGRECRTVPVDKPTMNFGWFTARTSKEKMRRAVLHEFGHALGCIHEHDSPAAGLKWNKPAVYKEYAKKGWTPEKVDRDLFDAYTGTRTVHSVFDPRSIMIYAIPKELLLDGSEVPWNTKLSEMDKAFISEMYPK